MTGAHPEREIDVVAAESLARGDATGWFETVYAAGADGRVPVPWDRPVANPLLTEWAADTVDGAGRTAVVIGCGLGRDAEFVAGLGFATVAFDVAETAVRIARDRNPGSPVDYRVADLLDPPASWSHAFDLVMESYTVQALPRQLRADATARVRSFVADGGTLLVIAASRSDDEPVRANPPWPLTRAELDAFTGDGLTAVRVQQFPDPGGPSVHRWRAEFTRAAAAG
jgi:SAM-dependent methyltransferase